jgi:sugar phosphate isomerase/epimerase
VLSQGVWTTAGVFAAAAITSCSSLRRARTGGSVSQIRFGLTTYQWGKDWDLPALIENCRKAGVLGTELRTSQSYAHGVELDIGAKQRQDVKRSFQDSPVTLVGIATSERFDSPDAEELRTAIENTKGYIRLSHDTGGSGARVFPNSFQKDVPREKTIEQIGRSLNTVGAFAADYGQQVRLEAHGSAGELPTIKAIMDRVTEPSVRVKLNCDKRDNEGEGLEHNFNLVKNLLGSTIHAHDFKDAEYPYQLMIDLLRKMGWSGWILLENSSSVPDRVASLIEQRGIFEQMLRKSLVG